MAYELQFKRYTNAEIAALTGLNGEIFIDTTNKTLVVQDGTTTGGSVLATVSNLAGYQLVTSTLKLTTLTASTIIVSSTATLGSGVTVIYNPGASTGAAINVLAKDSKGGIGYADFLVATNTSSGATNPSKWFRLTSTGTMELINSAYTTNILYLTDAGDLSVKNSISVNGAQAVNGPAFSAYAAAILQTIPNNVQTKVLFQTEEFDTNSNYANSRFTPTVAGYYQLNAEVRIDGATGTGEMMIILYKNGSEYKRGTNQSGTQTATNFWAMTVSSIAYANGTGDYFEIYVQQGSGGSVTVTAVDNTAITWFNGCMLRGA